MKARKKYVILAILFVTSIYVIGYSHYTSYRIGKEIDQIIINEPFTTYSMNEVKDYLVTNEYKIVEEKKGTKLNEKSYYITATKNDEYLYVQDEGYGWIKYTMENTSDLITPLIYGIEIGDSFDMIKDKLGLNIFNTLLKKAPTIINPRIYVEEDYYIELVCKKDYHYALYFDNGTLQQIIIQNFDVYDY